MQQSAAKELHNRDELVDAVAYYHEALLESATATYPKKEDLRGPKIQGRANHEVQTVN